MSVQLFFTSQNSFVFALFSFFICYKSNFHLMNVQTFSIVNFMIEVECKKKLSAEFQNRNPE